MKHKILQRALKALGMFLVPCSLLLASCEDEPDKYEVAGGLPTINYITAPKNPDSLLVEATPNTRICLVGDNLRSITKLVFNDREATLNESLITDHTLITSVPRALPDNPVGQIYAYNQDGDSTIFDFKVKIEAPKVNSINTTECKPGDIVTIGGDLFLTYENKDDHMSVTFPGCDAIDSDDFLSLTQYAVQVKVPDNATTAGPVTIKTKYGVGSSADKFVYHECEYYKKLGKGMLFDFEPGCMTQQGWNTTEPLTSGGAFDNGGCLCLNAGGAKEMDESGSWCEWLKFEYWAGNWSGAMPTEGQGQSLSNLIDMDKFPNLALRFEMKIPKEHPWAAGAMQCLFISYKYAQNDNYQNNTYIRDDTEPMASGWVAGYGDGNAPNIGRYLWRPWKEAENGEYHTNGEWITCTFPITEFTKGYKGGNCSTPLTKNDFDSLDIWPESGGENGKVCSPEIWYDNIRVVPYK